MHSKIGRGKSLARPEQKFSQLPKPALFRRALRQERGLNGAWMQVLESEVHGDISQAARIDESLAHGGKHLRCIPTAEGAFKV
jgi:hypothetical protein